MSGYDLSGLIRTVEAGYLPVSDHAGVDLRGQHYGVTQPKLTSLRLHIADLPGHTVVSN